MAEDLSRPIRCFIAIHVPPEIVRMMVDVQRGLQRIAKSDAVRWTPPEQMHITMKFLGPVPPDRLSALENALCKAVIGTKPFSLSLELFGCFPSVRDPSVLWAGLSGQLDVLRQVQSRIETETNCLASHQEEREFHPHVTIGRVRRRGEESRRIAEALLRHRMPNVEPWTVGEITLMRSTTSPDGAVHTRLAAARLEG